MQDDWKVLDTLTLSLGVRYEYPQPFVNSRDRRSIFDPNFPGGRLIYPGMPAYFVPGRGFIPTDKPLAALSSSYLPRARLMRTAAAAANGASVMPRMAIAPRSCTAGM